MRHLRVWDFIAAIDRALSLRILLVAILRYFSSNMVCPGISHTTSARKRVRPYMNAFSTSRRSASNRKVYRRTHEANGKVELSLLAYYRMAFQSKNVLCEDFSRAFNRQMNSKRQAAFPGYRRSRTAQFP